jgi:hypothetical protein
VLLRDEVMFHVAGTACFIVLVSFAVFVISTSTNPSAAS